MKKIIIALVIGTTFLLTGCLTTVDTVVVDPVAYNPYAVVYDPGYTNDYIYSVGYYDNGSYWGSNSGYNNYRYYNRGGFDGWHGGVRRGR